MRVKVVCRYENPPMVICFPFSSFAFINPIIPIWELTFLFSWTSQLNNCFSAIVSLKSGMTWIKFRNLQIVFPVQSNLIKNQKGYDNQHGATLSLPLFDDTIFRPYLSPFLQMHMYSFKLACASFTQICFLSSLISYWFSSI